MGKLGEESNSRPQNFKPSRFLQCMLDAPQVVVKDIKDLLKGRTRVPVSEVDLHLYHQNGSQHMSSLTQQNKVVTSTVPPRTNRVPILKLRKVKRNTLSTPSVQLDLRVKVLESRLSTTSMSRDPTVCLSDTLSPGSFYLTSQEGNRLQLMRYNGHSFETYDWQHACKENVAEGCSIQIESPDIFCVP